MKFLILIRNISYLHNRRTNNAAYFHFDSQNLGYNNLLEMKIANFEDRSIYY